MSIQGQGYGLRLTIVWQLLDHNLHDDEHLCYKAIIYENNINWRNVRKQNVKNNVHVHVDMSSVRAPWKNGPYKTNTQNKKKVEHQNARDIQKILIFVPRINENFS